MKTNKLYILITLLFLSVQLAIAAPPVKQLAKKIDSVSTKPAPKNITPKIEPPKPPKPPKKVQDPPPSVAKTKSTQGMPQGGFRKKNVDKVKQVEQEKVKLARQSSDPNTALSNAHKLPSGSRDKVHREVKASQTEISNKKHLKKTATDKRFADNKKQIQIRQQEKAAQQKRADQNKRDNKKRFVENKNQTQIRQQEKVAQQKRADQNKRDNKKRFVDNKNQTKKRQQEKVAQQKRADQNKRDNKKRFVDNKNQTKKRQQEKVAQQKRTAQNKRDNKKRFVDNKNQTQIRQQEKTAQQKKTALKKRDNDRRILTEKEMASTLRKQMVTPSVNFRTPNKAGHIDLEGKAHFDKRNQRLVDTPHVQTRELKVGKNGEENFPRKSEVTRPATKQDIRIAKKLAKKKRLFKDDEENEDKK